MVNRSNKILYILYLTGRIGHLTQEPFLLRNLYDGNEFEIDVITFPRQYAANKSVYDIVLRGLNVIHSTDKHILVRGIYNVDWLRREFYSKFIRKRPIFYFSLTDSELERGNQLRDNFGIPRKSPIVTLHVREPGYLPGLTYHSFRDSDIQNYVPAIKYLMKEGFYVVRIGDKTMKQAVNPPPQLIDAPFHPAYTDFADPYFAATSEFFIGVSSGPATLAEGFGVPSLMLNAQFNPGIYAHENDLVMFKKYFSRKLGRNLTYKEIILSPTSSFNKSELFEQAGIEVVQNSPDEILMAVKEMIARLNGSYPSSEENVNIDEQVQAINEKAHYYQKEVADPNKIPYMPYYALYCTNGSISHEYIKANPWFLGHD